MHNKIIEKLIEFRSIFIVIICFLCVRFEVPPFHVYYYSEPPFIHYFLITLTNILIYLFPTDKLIFFEKLIYASIVSIIALIAGGIIVGETMELIYGYDSNWDELKSPELLDSVLFYLATNLIGIGIFKIWLRYRKPIY
jgi:hypothetical protein